MNKTKDNKEQPISITFARKASKYLLISVISLIIFFGLTQGVEAAPSISVVSGNISDGQNITISGSDFGTNGPNIVFFDDFEGGTVGQSIKTGNGSATIGQWYSLNTVPVKYSSDTSVSGNKSFKAQGDPAVEGQVNGIIKFPDTSEVFISWWNYVPTNVPWSGESTIQGPNWKIMWLAQDGDYGTKDTLVWRIGGTNTSKLAIQNNSNVIAYPNTEPVNTYYFIKGRWQRISWWIRDSSTNNGATKLWALSDTGTVVVRDAANIATVSPGVIRNELSVNGHFIQHPTGTQPIAYFDDVYVATGPGAKARVEIGDAATYTTCKNLSIATVISWSDTSITTTVRQGSFTNGQQTYLYVVDSNGNVNTNGFSITIGGEAPPDTTPPAISNGSPTGALAAGTTQTTMSVTTNKNAACRWSSAAGTAYASMTNTFSTTGATSHSTTITGLSNGQTYNRYVRCQNSDGYANTSDYIITFSIASSGGTTITLYPAQDTYIDLSANANTGINTLNTYTWPANQIANAILMKFNLSSIPFNANIQDSKLYLYLTAADTNTSYPTYTNTLHRIINKNPNLSLANGYTYDGTNLWTASSCCYNNTPLAQADISSAYDTQQVNKTLGFKSWNAAQLIKDWLSNPSANYGLLINSDSAKPADTYRTFASSEYTTTSFCPYLEITYTLPVDTTSPSPPSGVTVQ